MTAPARIRVKLFGAFADAVGAGELERELAAGATVASLWNELVEGWPALAPLDDARLSAVNHEHAQADRALAAGDEVAFFPPVSGG